MRTRMQWVGFEQRFHKKVMNAYKPGKGVVMSAVVYRRLMGNILVFGGTVRRDGLKGRIPLPFVVVHSGYTTTMDEGLSRRMADSGTNCSLVSMSYTNSEAAQFQGLRTSVPGEGFCCGVVNVR